MKITGTFGCDRNRGPSGLTQCFLETPYYSKYQCGTCLTDAYIRQRSKGKHACRDRTATYCYYQCMIEKYGLEEGPVYDDCLCDANTSLPQPPVILDPPCYSPDGSDCGWYNRCLAEMYHCSGQADYAIQYGEKYCKLFSQSKLRFSARALRWIDAVRRCLQVSLVPLLHLCRERPTCKALEEIAFESHVPCYLDAYGGFSVCLLSGRDWLRIFWTIKGSYDPTSSTFLKTLKASATVAQNCTDEEGFFKSLGKVYFAFRVVTLEVIYINIDELAHSIVRYISSSLRWIQKSTVDWFASAAEAETEEKSLLAPSAYQSRKELRILVIDLNATRCLSVCQFVSLGNNCYLQ